MLWSVGGREEGRGREGRNSAINGLLCTVQRTRQSVFLHFCHEAESVKKEKMYLAKKVFPFPFSLQITWARQLPQEHSYQILTIAETTYIDDQRFIVTSAAVDNVSGVSYFKKISARRRCFSDVQTITRYFCEIMWSWCICFFLGGKVYDLSGHRGRSTSCSHSVFPLRKQVHTYFLSMLAFARVFPN